MNDPSEHATAPGEGGGKPTATGTGHPDHTRSSDIILSGLACENTRCICHKSATDGHGLTHCPSHDNHNTPSLSVTPPDRTAWPLLHCFGAGCSHKEILRSLRALGLVPREVAFNVNGVRHFRKDAPGAPKPSRWWEKGASSTAALYRGDALRDLARGTTVLLCEGEPATEAAIGLGFAAVGTVCGAAATPTSEALGVLKGFDVVHVPDAHTLGRDHMANVARALAEIGIQPRWLDVPGLPDGGDLADYTGDAEGLSAMVAAAPPWEPPRETLLAQAALINWTSFWASDPKQEDWLIEPLLPRGRQIALYSPAKQGKSLLALDTVARAATGQRVLDRREGKPLSICYFDFEMTEGDLYERLIDMGYGPANSDILSNLHYYLLPNLPPLDTPDGGAAVVAIARHHAADLVVIDTTSRVLSGPENDADTLRAFYISTGLPLKADGRTVLRLDHAGKDLGRGQRGTSAKNDDVDLVWELTVQDGNGVRLRATHRRQSWVAEVVELIRLDDPFRHERAAVTLLPGTGETADWLDELDVPLDWGIKKAGPVLRSHGHKARNDVINAAIRYRRKRDEGDPGQSGITSFAADPITVGDQPDFESGITTGISGDHPSRQSGISPSPLWGTAVPSPAEISIDEGGRPLPCECGDNDWVYELDFRRCYSCGRQVPFVEAAAAR